LKKKLEVFISSDIGEFGSLRKRISNQINKMPFLHCTPVEHQGARWHDTTETSLKAVRESQIYIGVLGKEYSEITTKEYGEAVKGRLPPLIYVKNLAQRDGKLSRFIETELKPRFKYEPFKVNKALLKQVKSDLDALIYDTLIAGLAVIQKRKKKALIVERKTTAALQKATIALRAVPKTRDSYTNLLSQAQQDFKQERYMQSLIGSTIAIEIALRSALAKLSSNGISQPNRSMGLGGMISEIRQKEILPAYEINKLLDVSHQRNRTLHEGWLPRREDAELALEQAENLLNKLDLIEAPPRHRGESGRS
jgi:hypothetical protein